MMIQYGTQEIDFSVEYRNRKTFEIGVEAPDIVTVIAPLNASEELILKTVRGRAKWIVQKLFGFRDVEYRHYDKEYVNGEAFMYLGRNHSLQIEVDDSVRVANARLLNGKFVVKARSKDPDVIKAAMLRWYREKTQERIADRVLYYQKHLTHRPASVTVKEQQKRWASCGIHGDLFFNWRCAMAPAAVLDYIVVHELCHLVVPNHSAEFWRLVERILPDYKLRREWLRNFGVRMEL